MTKDQIKKAIIIAGVLFLMTFLNTCNSCSSKSNSRQLIDETDSLKNEITNLQKEVKNLKEESVTTTELKIEGLKAELRAIEATDRRKIDMDRQGEIRAEIERLESKK
jgi:cell division protein FtsL